MPLPQPAEVAVEVVEDHDLGSRPVEQVGTGGDADIAPYQMTGVQLAIFTTDQDFKRFSNHMPVVLHTS